MIDMPQAAPPAYEQVLAHKLEQCGLRDGGFTVRYQQELQGFEIVIGEDAAASPAHFDCIQQAAGREIVTFSRADLGRAYSHHVFEKQRAQMLADARNELARHGALEEFPERAAYSSDGLFAEALERQCGVPPGSFFGVSQYGLSLHPVDHQPGTKGWERMTCLFAAISYVTAKGEPVQFGFVGNEAVAPEE